MTPAQLYAALDTRRRELGLVWWQVAIQADVDSRTLARIRYGTASQATRERCEEWLRRPVPPQKE